jgi:hypothetical protein
MSKNDEKIKTLMAAVEKQKADMGSRPRVSFKTNGLFQTSKDHRTNLNTVSKTNDLVELLGTLLAREACLAEAAGMLNVEAPSSLWSGHSLEDWAHDFLQQSKLIKWREQKAKLDKLNKKLGKLMSEDARTATELEDIEKMLG